MEAKNDRFNRVSCDSYYYEPIWYRNNVSFNNNEPTDHRIRASIRRWRTNKIHKRILNKVKLSLFNNFHYRAKLNNEECINYTTLVFKDLLNYFHKEFDDTDVVKTIAKTYDNFSVRTAKEEVAKLKIITNK